MSEIPDISPQNLNPWNLYKGDYLCAVPGRIMFSAGFFRSCDFFRLSSTKILPKYLLKLIFEVFCALLQKFPSNQAFSYFYYRLLNFFFLLFSDMFSSIFETIVKIECYCIHETKKKIK